MNTFQTIEISALNTITGGVNFGVVRPVVGNVNVGNVGVGGVVKPVVGGVNSVVKPVVGVGGVGSVVR